MKKYYVFRIDYNNYDRLIKEFFYYNRLRQGWGGEGMEILDSDNAFNSFSDGWKKQSWGASTEDKQILCKFHILQIMLEMKKDDIIVIPKVSKSKDHWRQFTVAKCNEHIYSFAPLDNDFGHIINAEPLFSCPYDHNDNSRIVSAKFRAYQKALNRVYNRDFINAIELLIEENNSNPSDMEKENSSSLDALLLPTSDIRKKYLYEIVKNINLWAPNKLENIITELFEKNGYKKESSNRYDKNGGDIDIEFSAFIPNTLLSDIFMFSTAVDMPKIRVQAKKKCGEDPNDKHGIDQLLRMQGDEQTINILINTAPDFSDDTKKYAGKNVILINGRQFAALLIKYGFDVADPENP